ncbi:hypothetical protein DPMN_062377 [Dreissena polymorpha]|uniref:Uncharacterized protein n=1 Tax=Dreissena polymorpha TaxID=45954 RepID=A0A9D4HHQ8_DREPO|nr:hypothetical protein DPMN_062377 [Dreissena polymorpha]
MIAVSVKVVLKYLISLFMFFVPLYTSRCTDHFRPGEIPIPLAVWKVTHWLLLTSVMLTMSGRRFPTMRCLCAAAGSPSPVLWLSLLPAEEYSPQEPIPLSIPNNILGVQKPKVICLFILVYVIYKVS